MGIPLRYSSSAAGTRNLDPVNMGGGANLVARSLFSTSTPTLPFSQWYTPGSGSPALSTSDYYQMGGLYWSQPYDLDTMGSPGATVKAREGFRYVWLLWCDHPGQDNWANTLELYVAFSNDPQVWPSPLTMKAMGVGAGTKTASDGQVQVGFNPYQIPFLVYNPDSAGDKFYIYSEASASGRQHQTALITSPDLDRGTATVVGAAIPTTTFTGWCSFARVTRLGVNSWEAYAFGKADGSTGTLQFYKYTSTDGWVWTPDYTTARVGSGPYLTIAGQDCILSGERGSNDYISYWPVNGTRTATTGAATRISNAFASDLTEAAWQTVLQDITAYVEDGVATIHCTRGFFPSDHDRTNNGPYLGNTPNFYNVTCSITSNVMTVTAIPGGVPPLAVGFKLTTFGRNYSITSLGTGTGGTGTYNITAGVPDQGAGSTVQISTNGGLWNQFVDQYYLITDATAAASAAPLGVRADCVSGVVTISWNNCLPHTNYRVYRGTSAGTQATLIGDVSGVSITDTPTPNARYWYKVVTMNSGEQKNRVIDVYASNNSQMVNRHVLRVTQDGGDTTKIDMTFLASVDSYLASNDYYKYLIHWVDARFGVKLDGSGFISKIYCLGTTRLPKYGDYTPDTSFAYPSTSSNTSYSATSFRGTTPSWINNATTARGYFGGGRVNTIQRKREITLIAAYQRPNTTGILAMFGMGEIAGLHLGQEAGTSGNIVFGLSPLLSSGTRTSATKAFASGATSAHVAAGVYDGTNMTTYLDGVAGTPVDLSSANNPTMSVNTILRGKYLTAGAGATPVLGSGSTDLKFTGTYSPGFSQSQATYAALIVFEKGLSSSAITAIGALYA